MGCNGSSVKESRTANHVEGDSSEDLALNDEAAKSLSRKMSEKVIPTSASKICTKAELEDQHMAADDTVTGSATLGGRVSRRMSKLPSADRGRMVAGIKAAAEGE